MARTTSSEYHSSGFYLSSLTVTNCSHHQEVGKYEYSENDQKIPCIAERIDVLLHPISWT